jgi:hypothetical protein
LPVCEPFGLGATARGLAPLFTVQMTRCDGMVNIAVDREGLGRPAQRVAGVWHPHSDIGGWRS